MDLHTYSALMDVTHLNFTLYYYMLLTLMANDDTAETATLQRILASIYWMNARESRRQSCISSKSSDKQLFQTFLLPQMGYRPLPVPESNLFVRFNRKLKIIENKGEINRHGDSELQRSAVRKGGRQTVRLAISPPNLSVIHLLRATPMKEREGGKDRGREERGREESVALFSEFCEPGLQWQYLSLKKRWNPKAMSFRTASSTKVVVKK